MTATEHALKARARDPQRARRRVLTIKQLEADDQEADRVARFDAILEEVDRADALALHLMDRLTVIDGDGRTELFALSLIARSLSDHLQLVIAGANKLFEAYQKTGGAQ